MATFYYQLKTHLESGLDWGGGNVHQNKSGMNKSDSHSNLENHHSP